MGTSLTLTPSGVVNDGDNGHDYTYTFDPVSTGTITALTVTLGGSRIYDGTTNAVASVLTVTDAIGSDKVDVASGTATLAGKDVGSWTITGVGGLVLGNNAAGDYTVVGATGTATISVRPITVTAAPSSKTYDGTTTSSAVPIIGGAGLAPGDTATFAETYSSKDVGTNLTLTPSGVINGGDSGHDYTCTFMPESTGAITPRAVVVGGTRTYDGTAKALGNVLTVTNAIGVNTVDVAYGMALLAGKDVGLESITDPSGLVLDNNGANDYTVVGATGTVTITPRPITVTAVASSKTYDGTTASAAAPTISSGSLAPGDTAGFAEAYGGKDVGTNLTLTPSGKVNDGDSGQDYTYTFDTVLTGAITPLTVTLGGSRIYDGTTNAAASVLTVTNAIRGDTVDVASGTATLAGKNAGSESIGGPGSLVLGNNAANDYTLVGASGTVTITPRAITVTAAAASKTYDGTTASAALPVITVGSLAPGDTAGFTQSYSGKDAGTGLTLSPGGTVHDGDGGADYNVTFHAASGTINPAPLIITADSLSMPFGGAVPALTASYAGFVNGETPASLTTPAHLSTAATSNSPAGAYAITAFGASSSDYAIGYVDGTLTVAPPVTPTNPRVRGAQSLVTTLYNQILGQGPDPTGLHYWTNRRLHGASKKSIMRALVRSSKSHAPALRTAARQPMIAPAGPMALLKSSHAKASTVGVLPHVHAGPRAARPV